MSGPDARRGGRRRSCRSRPWSRSTSPREFRLHPRDRLVAYTAEAAGARQLFTLSLRGGYPTQLTASDKPVSDPQWSPDGRRLAYRPRRRDLGHGGRRVAPDPGRRQARRRPAGRAGRPTAAGSAFISRRRGWSQIWLIDAPVPTARPAGGRPEAAGADRPDRDRASTSTSFEWSPDGTPHRGHGPSPTRSRATRRRSRSSTSRPGAARVVAGERSVDVGARWLADGSLLYVSDADGWFQVVRLTADGRDRIVLTAGEREHGEPGGGVGYAPLPSPDGTPVRPRRGPRRAAGPASSASSARGGAAQARPRPPAQDAADGVGRIGRPADQPMGRRLAVGRLAARRGLGRGDRRERDAPAGPLAAARPGRRGGRRAATPGHRFAACRAPTGPRAGTGVRRRTRRAARRATASASRERCGGPPAATGKRGGRRVPTIVYVHGGPTGQTFRVLRAVQAAPGRRRVRRLRRRLPGLDRLRARVPARQPRGVGPRRRPRPGRCRALGRRAALVGRPPRDLRRLVRRLHGPVRAGRRAGHVACRHRPLRRLGDRRELPAWRPASAASTCTR